jgi:hypothetical protein
MVGKLQDSFTHIGDTSDLWRIENITHDNTHSVTGMFSLGKARNTLERWFHHEDDENLASSRGDVASNGFSRREITPEERVQQFMEELRANSQEWLGRVRVIRFDTIRERMGPRWPKLQNRIEILAEKIIQNEMAPRDRYLHAGDAEFLVFFADATPEESRIRCLAIVEAIQEKLFGIEDNSNGPPQKVAECHVVHKDDLILEWELAASNDGNGSPGGSIKALSRAFRHDPEVLDGADIAASTQAVIDSIISRGSESKDASELTPLLMRLRYLSRSLKVLEPALVASANNETNRGRDGKHVTGHATSECFERMEQSVAAPLGTAWDDIVEVISVLGVGADCPHADLLEALRKLQRTRLERATLAQTAYSVAPAAHGKMHEPGQFAYIPIYRSVSQGERILQGLYRIFCSGLEAGSAAEDDDAIARHRHQAALERTILEHAIRYLLDRRTSRDFVLLAPAGVETLRSPSTLRQYSTVLRSAQLRAKRRLLIEVVGYSQTDHTIGMRRAIDELRLHSRAIFVTLSPRSGDDIERIATECKDLGAHAIGVNASQLSQYGSVLSTLARLASVGAKHSILTYVDGIDSVAVLAKAIGSGISYVCTPALRPALQAPDDAKDTTFDDLHLAI